ncbi:hypothetical protein L7F22_034903 [Adiantum nelumboides]|nr:hypothetical protein [Adiantum nelumboides]
MSLKNTHAALVKSFASSKPDLGSIKTQLTRAKIELTQSGLLVPSPADAAAHPSEVAMARDVLEIGALSSVRQRDVESFDRYMGLLHVFYNDCSTHLPPSQSQEALLGLCLLRLLSSNSISQFHTTLEALPAHLVASSPYIQHPVHLERWLMEGSYSKVWRARKEVPREEYSYFVDELMGTIRCVACPLPPARIYACMELTFFFLCQARDCVVRGKGLRQPATERCCDAALL